ncbi:asparagine synthase (glutamine-hydrolyzing) [Daejeonella sp.]|uniref:asparagine synthase (glutamine-hydrolyzing) n=1 Tax=Daejeonella sp. TaxID=2805397 RepID=UPI0025C37FDC|nr:asparagine synthase (glutamine-hydrolyzing) [Daejeonella sp.]
MCGIIGAITKKKDPDFQSNFLDPLNHALDRMEYRGPDNKDIWSNEILCLGHRRLSILDLSSNGNQPFESSCKRYIIVFNGEIYNYQELRTTLQNHGQKFRTNTDTEVILGAYAQFGADFCKQLRGMFALVIYDQEKNEIIFARDRIGKKPLFIYENEETLIFSSEVKFFHAFKNIPLEINEESLLNFLSLQYIPSPQSIYKNVNQVKAGEVLIYNLKTKQKKSIVYWDMLDHVGTRKQIPSLDEIDQLIEQSVKYRLVSNVDVGLLLSGGVDSSLLACYMTELSQTKVKSFNVGFSDQNIDESSYAKQVSSALNIDLISLNLEDISADNFSQSVFHADQPFGDSAMIPTYLISKSIGKHVKVVLSGEGADELFHGYEHYGYEKYYYGLGKLPFEGAEQIFNVISSLGIHKFDKIKNKLKSINSFKKDIGTSRWTSIISPDLGKQFLNRKNREIGNYENQFHSFLNQFHKKAGKLESSLMLDLLTWLPDDLLVKTDRMMMACSVEARTPFLDHELIEIVLSSSRHFNSHNFESKNYLRQLLKKKLPASIADSISQRPKHGFLTPNDKWLNSSLSDLSSFLFSNENLKNNPYLVTEKIAQLWTDYKGQKIGTNKRLVWNLFCFLEWYRQHETKFGFNS